MIGRRGGGIPQALGALVTLGAVAACQAVGADGSDAAAVRVIDQLTANCPAALTVAPAVDRVPTVVVYRRADDWKAALIDAPGLERLAAWPVNFAQGETVLRIDGGPQPTAGWRWQSGAPTWDVEGQIIRVPAALEPPPVGSMQAQVISQPCLYLHLSPARYQRVEVVRPR